MNLRRPVCAARPLLLAMSILLGTLSVQAQQGDIDVTVTSALSRNPHAEWKIIRPNTLRVQVRDELHQQIPGLQAGSFTIRRRGQLAEVIRCTPKEQVKELSQRVVLLIDNSGSMGPHRDLLLKDLDTLIAAFGRNTSIGLVLFGSRENKAMVYRETALPLTVRWFSTNKGLVVRQLYSSLKRDELIASTYLYDEIWAGYKMLEASRSAGKRDVAIVLSDGEDNASTVKLEHLQALDWGSTPLYAIDYMNRSSNTNLRMLSERTHGKYFQTNDIGELQRIFSTITRTMTLGGYEVEFKVNDPARVSHLRFSVPMEMLDSTSAQAMVDTLVVEEQIVRQRFPLLAYLFFDPGTVDLASRYRLIGTPGEADLFDETRISGNALDHYYQVLNILGSRMRKNPSAQIAITGCSDNDPVEAGIPEIGRNRAEAVRDYLKTVWGIDERRLQVAGRGLPEIPSTNTLEEGKAENRRVEIFSRDWEIVRPVAFEAREIAAKPPETLFKMEVSATDGLKEWILPLYAGGSLFHALRGTSAGFVDLLWNWKNEVGQLPRSPLRYQVEVIDSLDRKTIVPGATIPVKIQTMELKRFEHLPEKDVERISLILFDFARADLGPQNEKILRDVPERISALSTVTVAGFTDVIGEETGNMALSQRRSRTVRDRLSSMLKTGRVIHARGLGESSPLFTNALPEGRFYNRTVQIIIETPRPPQ
jgi:outer membrane protein OmpA-like peptidoglycan-associated protein